MKVCAHDVLLPESVARYRVFTIASSPSRVLTSIKPSPFQRTHKPTASLFPPQVVGSRVVAAGIAKWGRRKSLRLDSRRTAVKTPRGYADHTDHTDHDCIVIRFRAEGGLESRDCG